jgi:acetolactate synthase-1/2/3 large subunit
MAAGWIAEAERPLVITGRVGRRPASAEAVTRLVETVGMPLADTREFVNLPSGHPCYLEDDAVAAETLRSADLVLLVDVEVPWVPMNRRPPETARVVQIDLDPVKASMVNYGFRVDLPIQADSSRALWQLVEAVEAERTDERAARWQGRAGELAAASEERARARTELVARESSARPVSAVAVMAALNAVLDPDAVVMEEVTTNDMLVREHLVRERPGTIHAISAAGLGWALGAAMGVKLAEPERDVVALCGDGTFVFSSPVAALWAAHDAGAPFLTVILNNSGYRAAKFPVMTLFPDGASVSRQDFTGVVIAEPPDYGAVARACGAHGERVEEPERLVDALTEALKAVRSGRCAVVDVILDAI